MPRRRTARRLARRAATSGTDWPRTGCGPRSTLRRPRRSTRRSYREGVAPPAAPGSVQPRATRARSRRVRRRSPRPGRACPAGDSRRRGRTSGAAPGRPRNALRRWRRARLRHSRFPRRSRRARTPSHGTGAPSPRWPAAAAKATRTAPLQIRPANRGVRARRAARRRGSARRPPRAGVAGVHRRGDRERRPSPPATSARRRRRDRAVGAAIRRRRDGWPRDSRWGARGVPDQPRRCRARGTRGRARANRRGGGGRTP